MRQGDVPSAVVFVKKGTVLVTTVGPGGSETGCAQRGAGAIVGLELVTGSRANSEARALSPVTVCTLSPSAFTRWVGDLDCRPGAILKMALSEATRQRRERLSTTGSAPSRLARYLIDRDQGEPTARPPKLQRRVLARMLEMRPETLSRAIAALRRRGAISGGPMLRVVDAARLAEIAEEPR